MQITLKSALIGAAIALIGAILGSVVTGLFSIHVFYLTQPYMQKIQPDPVFWAGWGYVENTAVIYSYHVNGSGSDNGANLEICGVNKGKIDTGSINFEIEENSWLARVHAHLPNLSNTYSCVQMFLMQPGDCFKEKTCDYSKIPKGETTITVKYNCVACEPHIGEIPIKLCIEGSEYSCKKYYP